MYCSCAGGGWRQLCPWLFPISAPARCLGCTRDFEALGPLAFPFFLHCTACSAGWATGVSVCRCWVAVTWLPWLQGGGLEEPGAASPSCAPVTVSAKTGMLVLGQGHRGSCNQHSMWGLVLLRKMFVPWYSWSLHKQWMGGLLQTSKAAVTPT